MRRAGLLVNPRSGKSSGKGVALAGKLGGAASVSLRLLERFEQLPRFLDELGRDGVTDLFISSGDGTVQAILTELAERHHFAQLPRLALLPHGTTNLSGPDLGFRAGSLDAQCGFIRNLDARDLRQRATLRVANPGDGQVRHGLFVGTGAVAEATYFCQQAFNAKGVKGNWASFATLASAVGRSLFSPPNPSDPTRLDRPFPLSVEVNGETLTSGDQLLIMATTLESLILGTRPFWNRGDGAIRCTTIPYPVPSVLRWILPVMYGGENRQSPPGCRSFTASAMAIRSASRFVIDGEFFDPPAGEPLRIETGPLFSFIRG